MGYLMEKKVITLDKFEFRDYQLPLIDAIENKGYKRVIGILPRRCGKDYAAWNIMIRAALMRVGVYWYIGPTYSQMRKIIWDAIDNDGNSFLSFIPEELIDSKNSQTMTIRLVNGSIIQMIGSEKYDALRGANPVGCIFTEYSMQNPKAWDVVDSIFKANNGWVIFISTPKGKNHFYDLWEFAKKYPNEWFAYIKTIDDTKHIDIKEIERDIENRRYSYDFARQEYWCSFAMGVDGSVYGKALQAIKSNDQIGNIPYNPSKPVHTAWDLGWADPTVIIFFQYYNNNIYIIDFYKKSFEHCEHFAKYIANKPYHYGRHIGPHDLENHEQTSGLTRKARWAQLGIRFHVSKRVSKEEGLEAVRANIPSFFIDEKRCKDLIVDMENYRYKFDESYNRYSRDPIHDAFSHSCDALKYLCLNLSLLRTGMTQEDADALRYSSTSRHDITLPRELQMPRY